MKIQCPYCELQGIDISFPIKELETHIMSHSMVPEVKSIEDTVSHWKILGMYTEVKEA